MEKKKHVMPQAQKNNILEMDSGAVLDFQLRLQIECGLTHQEACDYISQAYEDD